jgi:hypothetical protein
LLPTRRSAQLRGSREEAPRGSGSGTCGRISTTMPHEGSPARRRPTVALDARAMHHGASDDKSRTSSGVARPPISAAVQLWQRAWPVLRAIYAADGGSLPKGVANPFPKVWPPLDEHSCSGQGTAGMGAPLVEDHGRSPARLARRSRARRNTGGFRHRARRAAEPMGLRLSAQTACRNRRSGASRPRQETHLATRTQAHMRDDHPASNTGHP